MSPDERVGLDVAALVAEVRDDLDAIDRLAARLREVCARAAAAPSGDRRDPTDVMAAAGYLHHLYTAMESIHERIAATIDGAVPSGERWHQELLTRVGLPLPGVRGAVLSPASRAQLARFLRFRHFFRHAYRTDLLWVELAPIAADADETVALHRRDLESFLDALTGATRA